MKSESEIVIVFILSIKEYDISLYFLKTSKIFLRNMFHISH